MQLCGKKKVEEDLSLLGCEAVSLGERFSMF
jgi:hypothetical protein